MLFNEANEEGEEKGVNTYRAGHAGAQEEEYADGTTKLGP